MYTSTAAVREVALRVTGYVHVTTAAVRDVALRV